ncbi:HNH endonuclease signature motif containing protein [Kribbella antiqua]|nr:HNH endonuclease signature motif containing protein [Kribbella antiqua]
MFDDDLDELDTADLLVAAAQFVDVQEHAAVRLLEAALAFADRYAVVNYDSGEVLPGTERLKVYGGDGCPGVAEFAPVEFGAVTRMSTGAASSFIGEALALRHRLPRIWAAVLAGNAVPWRARKIAHACLSLSLEAAAIVDRRVVGIVNTVTPTKLATIVKAAMWEADPDLARAHAEAVAKARGVYVGPSDDHGTKRFWVRAAAGDVIRFDATINDIAHALKILGDPDSLDERRAKAIGWIADPAAAHHLLQVARYLARTRPHIPDNDDPGHTHTPTADRPATSTEATAPAAAPDERPAPDDWPPPEDDTVLDDDDHGDHDHDGGDDHDHDGDDHDGDDHDGDGAHGDDGHDRTAGRDWTKPADDTVSNDGVGGDDRTAARDWTKPADDNDRDNGHNADDWNASDGRMAPRGDPGPGDSCDPDASSDSATQSAQPTNDTSNSTAETPRATNGRHAPNDHCAPGDDTGLDGGRDVYDRNTADDWPAPDDGHNTDDRNATHDSIGPDDGAVPDDSHDADDADDCNDADDATAPDDDAVPDDGGDAYDWNASYNRDGPEDWMAPNDDPGPEDWDDPDDHGTAANTGQSGVPGNEAADDAFTRRMLAGSLPARLAALKQHAYSHGLAADTGQRPNRHTLYVHLTDRALATGNGVLRVEELGPLLLNQLSELLGHDQIIVKPVIDLREQVNVHCYEIPDRIRERVRLRHPVDMFPYGAAEATTRMDQDHITPYDRTGPPGSSGQTDPDNLIPLGRLHHRAKTFGGWRSRRLPTGGVEWISPHGFRFHVDHTGTHPMPPDGMADPS